MKSNDTINMQLQRGQRAAAQAQRRFNRAVKLRADELLAANEGYLAHVTEVGRLASVVRVARLRLNKAGVNRERLLRDIQDAERRIVRSQAAEREAAAGRARVQAEIDVIEDAARDAATAELAEVFSATTQTSNDSE